MCAATALDRINTRLVIIKIKHFIEEMQDEMEECGIDWIRLVTLDSMANTLNSLFEKGLERPFSVFDDKTLVAGVATGKLFLSIDRS